MKLDEHITERIARYTAEVALAQAKIQMAEVARLQSMQAEQVALAKLRALYKDAGLDVNLHEIMHDDNEQSNGSVIPKGTVIDRKTRKLYEPPPATLEPAPSVEAPS